MNPTTLVVPRDAATLLVLSYGTDGPEVLMGVRHARHAFMPNSLVFPGGAVDAGDFSGRVASQFAPLVHAALLNEATPELVHALGVAVARELEEETGLSLGRPPELGGLDYLCRAITPSNRPRRFDARFFVVLGTLVSGELAGSGELERLRRISVADALSCELELATRGALEQLVTWLSLPEPSRRTRGALPVLREREWTMQPVPAAG